VRSPFLAFLPLLAWLPVCGCRAKAEPPTRAAAFIRFQDAFPGLTFDRPVCIVEVPGATAKTMAVVEQHLGRVSLVRKTDAGWTKGTFYERDVSQENEMGLLGIAFHPDFRRNGKYYIAYDPTGPFYNVVEERRADSTLTRDAGSGRVLIRQADKYSNHNGGTLAFGPKDGLLYVGMGDGGSHDDPDGNGQNKQALLGKLLRIDVDKRSVGLEYAIPADNPFAKGGGRGEIFAYGLRNPWKWAFDPVTGDLWAGDVGQNAVEEVDMLTRGGNYGWNRMEGPEGNAAGGMILPVYSYSHEVGQCIIGGVVFRGDPASRYAGNYFFADYSQRQVWALRKNAAGPPTVEQVGEAPYSPTTFGSDAEGLIYLGTDQADGPIYYLDSPDLAPVSAGSPKG
jgi:glucose/arabinose dehydrogenase